MRQPALLSEADIGGYWIAVKDGDPAAARLYRRHYSYYEYADGRRERYGYRNRNLIIGPGDKLVLVGIDGAALCCWRHGSDANSTGQRWVFCSVFRNESPRLASVILAEAMLLAWQRWPGETLYTYVDPTKIKPNRKPGRVFLRCGWQMIGTTATGKLILRCFAPAAERKAA